MPPEFTALRQIVLDSMLDEVCKTLKKSAMHRAVEITLKDVYVFPKDEIPRLRAYFKVRPTEDLFLDGWFDSRLYRLVPVVEAYAFIKRRLENEHPLYRVKWMPTKFPSILISWVQ